MWHVQTRPLSRRPTWKMICHKIVTGLADADILQDVLSADLKGLEQTVVFVEGKESGKKGQQSLASPAGINKVTSAPLTTSQERCRFCRDLDTEPTLGRLSGYHHVQPGMLRVINAIRRAISKQPARARLSPPTRSA